MLHTHEVTGSSPVVSTKRICVTVAHRTLTPFAGVRIPHPLPKQDATQSGGVFVLAENKGWDSNPLNADIRWTSACAGLDGSNLYVIARSEATWQSPLRLFAQPTGDCHVGWLRPPPRNDMVIDKSCPYPSAKRNVIPSETKWSRGIYALPKDYLSNRCVDPSTRIARSG